MSDPSAIHCPTIVIGGGQAGLSVGHHLAAHDLPFVILDANARVADAWRHRWDSLRLFTPARMDGLDGMPFPAEHPSQPPTKDEVVAYLEAYAARLRAPIRHNTRVSRLSAAGAGFDIVTNTGRYEADNVVVAMSSLQVPTTPAMAAELGTQVLSMHSHEYSNPAQLRPGGVLVVGAGNSGAQISVEVARSHPTWLAGEPRVNLPFRIDGAFGRYVGSRIIGRVFMHVLTTSTPLGRRAKPQMLSGADPLLRDRPPELRRAGVQRIGRVTAVRAGKPVADEQALDVSNVIWATGYRPGLEWVDIPVLDERGMPRQDRGVVPDVPGLYFVGQNFLYAKASETLPGVSRDARHVVDHLRSTRIGRVGARSAESTKAA